MRQAILDGTTPFGGRPERPSSQPGSGTSPHASEANLRVRRDRDRAIVSRGERQVALSLAGYRGIAARVEPIDDERVSVTLELNHEDPDRSVLLVVADDPAEIVADWQAFSRNLELPMLLIEADGTVSEPLPHLGQVLVGRPRARRPRSDFAGRRPRFLVRRKTGWDRGREVLDGAEIIARD